MRSWLPCVKQIVVLARVAVSANQAVLFADEVFEIVRMLLTTVPLGLGTLSDNVHIDYIYNIEYVLYPEPRVVFVHSDRFQQI